MKWTKINACIYVKMNEIFVTSEITSLPLGEAKEPGRDDDQGKVENEESEQHPNISPPASVADVQREEEILSNGVLTVSASRGIVGIVEVSTESRYELVRPSTASLTRWRIEQGELVGFTRDLESVKLGGNHRAHNPCERIEVIQPCPRPRSNVGVGNRNTAECGKDSRGERVE